MYTFIKERRICTYVHLYLYVCRNMFITCVRMHIEERYTSIGISSVSYICTCLCIACVYACRGAPHLDRHLFCIFSVCSLFLFPLIPHITYTPTPSRPALPSHPTYTPDTLASRSSLSSHIPPKNLIIASLLFARSCSFSWTCPRSSRRFNR